MAGLERERARSPRSQRMFNESRDYQERVTDFYSPHSAKTPTGRDNIPSSTPSVASARTSTSRVDTERSLRTSTLPISANRSFQRFNDPLGSSYRQSNMTQSMYVTNAASVSVGVASVIAETILAHPLIVLRRQCQVSTSPRAYHLGPFSILPITFKLVRNQGLVSLTKGMGTSFVLRGTSTVIETALAEMLDLPREVTRYSSGKQYVQFLALKLLSGAILLPMYAAHLTECVQSDVVGERMSLSDFFRDVFDRAVNLVTFGARPATMRMFPLWKVLVPASVFFASHFVIRSIVQHFVQAKLTERIDEAADARALAFIPESPIEIRESALPERRSSEFADNESEIEVSSELINTNTGLDDDTGETSSMSRRVSTPPFAAARRMHHTPAQHDDLVYERFYVELISAFIGAMVADMQLYAAETVVNRLSVQGTRALIDDMATGVNVVPVSFHYSGVLDAVRSILTQEGGSGFYRGFGALVLQYSLHLAVIKLGRFTVERIVDLYATRRGRRSTAAPLRQGLQKYKLPPRRNRDD